MLQQAYPFYLANEPCQPNTDLEVTDKFTGDVATRVPLADAAAKAGRDARVLFAGGAGPDHPVALECPETQYLETVILELR